MANSPQHQNWISKINRLAASAALTLAVVFVSAALTTHVAQAQTLTTLYSFCAQRGCPNGDGPGSALVQGTDGNFYGTLNAGGANKNATFCVFGCGAIYKITPTGELTTLYSFCSLTNCADGEDPSTSLVLATDGNFYGTTPYGDTGANCPLDIFTAGCGTVFRITPTGKLTTIHSFCSLPNCADGSEPRASLIQAADGNLYGTTQNGGANGIGSVYKITLNGTLTTLSSFCSPAGVCNDGQYPSVGLVQATNGDFYGATAAGGAHNKGTIFKITPAGVLTTLHTFHGAPDGDGVSGGLSLASNGTLYGETFVGGANGDGTIFSITPGGTFTSLYTFCAQSGCADGSNPYNGLVPATDGNLYGLTDGGGVYNNGTIFKITTTGTLTTIYEFCEQSGCPDGTDAAGLFQATDGNFYGTTYGGGANDYGTFYSLSVGLGPFVKTLPIGGIVGKRVGILGTDLTGATSVTFNGVPATFTVVSASLITTTVPTGATTGNVQVVTPGGTLSSNAQFYVIP